MQEISRLSLDETQQLRDELLSRVRMQRALAGAKRGLALGMGLAGGGLLAKTLSSSVSPPKSSFTQPVDAVVYRPDREKRRSRKRSSFLLPDPPQSGAAKALGEKDHADWAVALASTLAGLPIGFLAANKLSNSARQVARHNELRAAQREFETALQQYAESGDEPRKLERKRAALSPEEVKIRRLAENCHEICKSASLTTNAAKALTAYMVLSPLIAGAYGFSDKWSDRAYKDLDLAERQLNVEREKTNPTFTVATLRQPPDLDKPIETEEDEQMQQQDIKESLDEAVNSYEMGYL